MLNFWNTNSTNLVEFRAGQMERRGTMVHPIVCKGLVYLKRSQEDNLVHFYWKDRTTGRVKEDITILPAQCTYERVRQCTTGRVYVLKFENLSKCEFFWMQEPKTDMDDYYCEIINTFLKDQRIVRRGLVGRELFQGHQNFDNFLITKARRAFRNTPSGTSNTRNTSNPSTPNNSNNAPPNPVRKSEGRKRKSLHETHIGENAAANSTNIDLTTAIASSETINENISDPEKTQTPSVHLPESDNYHTDEKKDQQIKNKIDTPKIPEALCIFKHAFRSGQLGSLAEHLKMPKDAITAARAGNFEDFFKALQRARLSETSMDFDNAINDTDEADENRKDKEGDGEPPATDKTDENNKPTD